MEKVQIYFQVFPVVKSRMPCLEVLLSMNIYLVENHKGFLRNTLQRKSFLFTKPQSSKIIY